MNTLTALWDAYRSSAGTGVNGASYTVTRLEDDATLASGTTASDSAPLTALLGTFDETEVVLGYPGPIKVVVTGSGGSRTHTSKSTGIVGPFRAVDITKSWWLHGVGVFPGVGGALEVTTNGSNMQITVASGAYVARVADGDGLIYSWPASRVLTATAADGSQPRIDTMVLRFYPPGVDEQGRIDLVLRAGTPGASPTAVSLTQGATYWEVALADIRVDAGVTALATDKVTDRRAYAMAWPDTVTAGDLFYVDATGKLAKLAKGTEGFYLRQGAAIPAWDDISADDVLAAISDTEFAFLDGVTSNIQTQLDARQPLDAQLTDIAGLTPTDNGVVIGNGTNFVVESGSTLRTSIGAAPNDAVYIVVGGVSGLTSEFSIGSLVTGILKNNNASTPTIAAEGVDYWKPGGTDVALADGGTGASTAAAARTNLGLAIGSDVQAFSSILTAITSDGVGFLGDYLVVHHDMLSVASPDASHATAGTFGIALTTDMTLPTGTWTVWAVGGLSLINSASSSVSMKLMIDNTYGSEMSGVVGSAAADRQKFIATSSKTGVTDTSCTIRVEYGPTSSGTASAAHPFIFALAIRTA